MNTDYRIIYPYKIANIQNNYNKIVLIQQYYIPKDEHRLEELNKYQKIKEKGRRVKEKDFY